MNSDFNVNSGAADGQQIFYSQPSVKDTSKGSIKETSSQVSGEDIILPSGDKSLAILKNVGEQSVTLSAYQAPTSTATVELKQALQIPSPNPNPEVLKGGTALFSNAELNNVVQQYSGNLSLLQFMKVLSDAIQNLEHEISQDEQQSPTGDQTTTGADKKKGLGILVGGGKKQDSTKYSVDPFISAFQTASNMDPVLTDLILMKARVDLMSQTRAYTLSDGSGVNLKNDPVLFKSLQDYGFLAPTSDGLLTNAQVKDLLANIDQKTNECQSNGVLSGTIKSILDTSISAILPMTVNYDSLFQLLHMRNEMKILGYDGSADNLAQNKIILQNHPEIIKTLQKLGILGSGKNLSDADITGLMNKMDIRIKAQMTAAPMTAAEMASMSTQRSAEVGAHAAKHFLTTLAPMERVLRQYIQDQPQQIFNESNLSATAQQNLQDMAAAGAVTQVLNSAIHTESDGHILDNFNNAMTLLSDLSSSKNLVKAFYSADDYQMKYAAWRASPDSKMYKYDNRPNSSNLPDDLQQVFDVMKYYPQLDITEVIPDPLAPPSMLQNLPTKYIDARVVYARINATNILEMPQAFPFLRQHPELRTYIKDYDKIMQMDPLISKPDSAFKYSKKTLANIPSDKTMGKIDAENLDSLRATLKTLQKILASLQTTGEFPQDLVKATKTVSASFSNKGWSLPDIVV